MEVAKTKYDEVKNFVGGEFQANGQDRLDIYSPLNGNVISKVPLSGMKEVDAAVQAAQQAFKNWSAIPIKDRVQVFYKYKTLLEKHRDELAMICHEENLDTLQRMLPAPLLGSLLRLGLPGSFPRRARRLALLPFPQLLCRARGLVLLQANEKTACLGKG